MADVQKLFDKLYDCIIEKMQYDCFDARFNLEVLDLETGEGMLCFLMTLHHAYLQCRVLKEKFVKMFAQNYHLYC